LTLFTFSLASCALALGGCASVPRSNEPVAPAAYDWSDYQGTFAEPDERPQVEAATATAKATAAAPTAVAPAPEEPTKRVSKGTIQGESVSSVSVGSVADASKSLFKAKVLSSKTIVGREYEQLQVVMKGTTVQIIRPAQTPAKAGPKLRSPRSRSAGLSRSESGWYDADADVLVVVRAPRRLSSKKALVALLQKDER
jgi:hypothetical protein